MAANKGSHECYTFQRESEFVTEAYAKELFPLHQAVLPVDFDVVVVDHVGDQVRWKVFVDFHIHPEVPVHVDVLRFVEVVGEESQSGNQVHIVGNREF